MMDKPFAFVGFALHRMWFAVGKKDGIKLATNPFQKPASQIKPHNS